MNDQPGVGYNRAAAAQPTTAQMTIQLLDQITNLNIEI